MSPRVGATVGAAVVGAAVGGAVVALLVGDAVGLEVPFLVRRLRVRPSLSRLPFF